MEIILQSLKNVFLFLTTITFIIISLKSSYKGLLFYMACLILCSLTGFERAIYYEGYLVPGVILFKTLYDGKFKIDATLLIFALYVIAISLINGRNPFPLSNPIFLGIVLLSIKDNLFDSERKCLMMLSMLWLYIFAKMVWYVIYSPDPLAMTVVGDRLLEVNSILVTSSDAYRGGLDPNYFGYMMGTGFLISLIGIVNYNMLMPYFKNKWIKYLLMFTAGLELFFSLKGLSRGVFLAEVGAISFLFLLFLRKKHKYMIAVLISFIIFITFSGIGEMLYARFIASNSASRLSLAQRVISSMYEWNGVIGCFLGGGTDFPWNKYSLDPFLSSFNWYSTHNSWLAFFVNYGLIGCVLLAFIFIRKIHKIIVNQKVSWLNRSKLILIVYFLLITMSLEPLKSYFGWLLLITII